MSRKGAPIIKTCPHCNDQFDAREHNKNRELARMMNQIYCSRSCSKKAWGQSHFGEKHYAWKGGVFIDRGYKRQNIYIGEGKRTMPGQHVVIMESVIGRKLTKDEVVHHKDRNRSNNDISNLQLMTRSEHSKHHAEQGHYFHAA